MQNFGPEGFQHNTASACLVDLTPPTFAGVTGSLPQPNGSVLLSWPVATDTTLPVTYDIYALPGTVAATAVFAATSKQAVKSVLSSYVFRDSNDALLTAQDYTFGVRARDAVNNLNTNLAVLTVASSGVLTDSLATIAQSLANTEILLTADHINFQADHVNFQGDHTNFAADDAAFDADHANFVNDHTDFQSDHTNFVADHVAATGINAATSATADALAITEAALAADHVDFTADHANFVADHLAFVADDAAFDQDHLNLVDVTDAASGVVDTLAAIVLTLDLDTSEISSAATSISASSEVLNRTVALIQPTTATATVSIQKITATITADEVTL